jgi:anti-sigma regulatory factor (Ser/Thr protein kinase)
MTRRAESKLLLESNALAVRAIGGWLRDITVDLDSATAAALHARAELATHEACMNVIDHAELPTGTVIELVSELDEDRLLIVVRDQGNPFELDRVVVPEPHAAQERGYGVKIIRALADELTYRRVGSTNELELRFNITTTPG